MHYGIDFGTTNSATVGMQANHLEYYGDESRQPYPSIIAIDKITGEVRDRGRPVWENREQLSESCEIISSVKSYLGTDKTWNIGTRTWYPQEVATEIFRGLKKQVSMYNGGESMNSALVSIPIGFDPYKRRQLRNAAANAGVKVDGFVSEPTAAVFKHFETVSKWQKIAVFDWGGGTLDLAVVELNDGKVNELNTLGYPLGGDNLDLKIAEWAHNKILKATSANIPFSEMPSGARDRMISSAEEAKRVLAAEEEVPIFVAGYGNLDAPQIIMTSQDIKSLLKPELERAVSYLEEVVVKAGLSVNELGCVLMVGGSSKLRGLYDHIEDRFDCEIIEPDSTADWHVAHGACLLNKIRGQYQLSQNVGLLLSDDSYFPLLKKYQAVTHKQHVQSFGLVEDSQTANFVFVESSKGIHRTLGYISVPSYGFLFEPVELHYRINKDLLLEVSAKSGNMGSDGIEKWEYAGLRFSYTLPV